MKFRHAISRYQPVGQALRRVVYWPDVMQANRRWWQRPLADEGLLALTDRTLTLMTGEPQRSWFRARAETRYGYVITYCPLCRLAGATWSAEGMIASLELALRNPQGGETLSINLPQCRSAEVNALAASYPPEWPRKWPKTFAGCYVLNDDLIADMVQTMLQAWDTYGDQRYFDSACAHSGCCVSSLWPL